MKTENKERPQSKRKGSYRPLKVVLHILAALIVLLLCHCAASPAQLLPAGFRYGAYAVSELSYEAYMKPGDLVICDRSITQFNTGAVVLYRQHAFSSAGYPTETGAAFGRLVAYEAQRGDMLDVYTVQVNYNGESHTAMSAKPEVAVYRISGLGSAIMALHSARYLVWGLSALLVAGYCTYMGVTANKRKIKRNRESYLSMFEQYAQELEAKDTENKGD